MAVCETYDPSCYGCSLRSKGITLSNAATESRSKNMKPGATFAPRNSWEAGVAGEHRPGGGFMPYLNASNEAVGVKEYGERRREIDARVKELKAPEPTVAS